MANLEPGPELWHSGCPVGSYSETDTDNNPLPNRDPLRREALKLLRNLTSSFWDLAKFSDGVTGLHLNGDIATWDYHFNQNGKLRKNQPCPHQSKRGFKHCVPGLLPMVVHRHRCCPLVLVEDGGPDPARGHGDCP